MKVPKRIAKKARAYSKAQKKAAKEYKKVIEWLNKNSDAESVYVGEIFITHKPSGENQGDGEYCSQSGYGDSGDSFHGTYYHQIKGSKNYLAYEYDC